MKNTSYTAASLGKDYINLLVCYLFCLYLNRPTSQVCLHNIIYGCTLTRSLCLLLYQLIVASNTILDVRKLLPSRNIKGIFWH